MSNEIGQGFGRLGRIDLLRALVIADCAELVELVEVVLHERDVDPLPFCGIQFGDVLVELDGGDGFSERSTALTETVREPPQSRTDSDRFQRYLGQ